MERYLSCKVGGLANVANTCYLNSAIQCLAHNVTFLDYVINYKEPTGLMKELQELLQMLWFEESSVVPNKFISYLRKHYIDGFNIHDQNDVQEFLIFFIDLLNKSISYQLNSDLISFKEKKLEEATSPIDILKRSVDLHWHKSNAKEYSPFIDMFYGLSVSQIKCNRCGHISHNHEIFSSISVSLDHHELADNISSSFQPELLSQDAKCEKCKHNALLKSNKLYYLPKILIVLLKRFDTITHKITSKISVPETLDISSHSIYDKATKYNLKSIACHSGSLNSGHYCAVCKHPSGEWCIFDDDAIIPVSSYTSVNSSLYYVIFYEKSSV